MKVIHKAKLTEVQSDWLIDLWKEAELIQTEVAILSLVQHKNIVKLIETFETSDVAVDGR